MATTRGVRTGEAAFGGGVLALGLFIAFETWRLPVAPMHAAVGPRLFPYLVATGLVLVGLALLREALAGHVAHEEEGGLELDWRAVGLISAGLVAEMLLLRRAGWILAAALLYALAARAFGSGRPLLDAAIGLALAGATFVAFNYGLGLNLPAGRWGELLAPAGDAAG